MLSLGPFAFAAPLALVGLVALPAVWWLLRATPPPAKRQVFAPLALLRDVPDDDETPAHTPWWLLVLRLGALALVILGLARPILFPEPPSEADALVVIVDDGWSSAARWPQITARATDRLEGAARAGRPVLLAFTAPDGAPRPDLAFIDAQAAQDAVAARRPQAWAPDRADALARLLRAREQADWPDTVDVVWMSDGVDHGGADAFAQALSTLGALTIDAPGPASSGDPGPLALVSARPKGPGLTGTIRRLTGEGARTGVFVAREADGRSLGRATFAFEPGARETETRLELPLDLRNRIARIDLDRDASAGAARVVDARWRRPRVGLAAVSDQADRQPLLSDLYYVEQAIAPFSEPQRGPVQTLIEQAAAAIILTDAGRVLDEEAAALTRFVQDGGLLVRFAGPRLAARADALTPVLLREGGRSLGGALAWDTPQGLSAFPTSSPFFGLRVDPDIVVETQVLAQPAPDLGDKTWAALEDGTPLVTAARRGAGWIVLIHVTAGPNWSNLALSGLYVEMLERIIGFADAGSATPDTGAEQGVWRLDRGLDGFGQPVAPSTFARPIPGDAFADTRAGPQTPPGLYVRAGATQALNVAEPDTAFEPLPPPPPGARLATGETAAPVRLIGPLLAAALAVLALDALVALSISGRLRGGVRRWRRSRLGARAAAVALAIPGAVALAPDSRAQDPAVDRDIDFAVAAALETRFAYVRTGDPETDRLSRQGLVGLARVLNARTALEPSEIPVAIDLDQDALEFFPFLYWPIQTDLQISPDTAAKLDRFVKSGGALLLDTQDAERAFARAGAAHPGLARLAEALDLPPLQPAPPDHVLTKAFYLLQDFPGRFAEGRIWVEAGGQGGALDGVSSVVVGAQDWAAAWAVDDRGRPLAPIPSGDERQREMAYRFGVNFVMYVMTGNYKADQVHVPAILERLGQ